jgi:ribosomal-protein-alanine N-acetyltransferase
VRVRLELASLKHERAFLAAVRASWSLHRPWTSPPSTSRKFRAYVRAKSNERNIAYFAFSRSDELVGVVNISEIVRGPFCSAYLGYYVFAPHHARGIMTAVLSTVVTRAFRTHGLHRVEANIQPGNVASIRLVRRLSFRKEGLSLRYLKIDGSERPREMGRDSGRVEGRHCTRRGGLTSACS